MFRHSTKGSSAQEERHSVTRLHLPHATVVRLLMHKADVDYLLPWLGIKEGAWVSRIHQRVHGNLGSLAKPVTLTVISIKCLKESRRRKVTCVHCSINALTVAYACFLGNSADIAPPEARLKNRAPPVCALSMWECNWSAGMNNNDNHGILLQNPKCLVWLPFHLMPFYTETSFVEFSRDVYRELLTKSKTVLASLLTFL